ncbi:hypothetical protein B1757_12980 [Acidithiobacillus marinus]|uniref:Uncharacterized protein n=2 Tax=Acidithiobacillus marinus TaxID=187490 RepID=A0A2I1DIW3_9PROT|nr:hypothetical protein B1757_12980 [Acidithiobacillus marinus]
MLNAPAMSPNGFFSRPSLPGGIRPVTAIIKAVARAFTFASIFSSVWFVFLFLVKPSALHSLVRYTALQSDGIAVWMMIFLILMAVYLSATGLTAIGRMMDRFDERYPEKADTIMMVAALLTMLLMGSFVVYDEVTGEPVVKTASAIVAPHQQSQALLHIEGTTGNLVHTKNIVGAAKIERLGPGHYEIWMRHPERRS